MLTKKVEINYFLRIGQTINTSIAAGSLRIDHNAMNPYKSCMLAGKSKSPQDLTYGL